MKIGNAFNPRVNNTKMVNKSKNTGNTNGRFCGNVRVNTKRIDEAKNMKEPNWYRMDYEDLLKAHVLCNDRAKSGDRYWIGVRSRIEDAIQVKVVAMNKVAKSVVKKVK